MKKILILILALLLSACAEVTPFQFLQNMLGYIPPPEKMSIADELRAEFERCERVDPNRHCAQIAFDMVRKVRGLDPRTVPKGIVIIFEGDVDLESEYGQPPPSQQRDQEQNQQPQ